MGLAWTVLLNGMLGVAAYGTARGGLRLPAGPTRWLASATLGWAWATLGLELLGAVGWLARGPLLAWTGCGLAVGLWLGARAPREDPADLLLPAGPRWGVESIVSVGLVLWAAT